MTAAQEGPSKCLVARTWRQAVKAHLMGLQYDPLSIACDRPEVLVHGGTGQIGEIDAARPRTSTCGQCSEPVVDVWVMGGLLQVHQMPGNPCDPASE